MWLLVLIVLTNTGTGVTTVPTPYPSKESCEAAARSFKDQQGVVMQFGNCIPAPEPSRN